MTDFFINLGLSKTQAGDATLFLVMLLISVALIFVVKKSKLGAFVYSVYASYSITNILYFDFAKKYTAKIWIFLLLALGLHYFLFKPTVVVKLGSSSTIRWVKRVIIALAVVGFMATIILHWMPDKEVLKMLSPTTLKLFTTKFAKLLWAIAPLVVIAIVRKKEY